MIVEHSHSTKDKSDWPHLREKHDRAEGDPNNGRRVEEADSPAMRSHPDRPGRVTQCPNICINTWQQKFKTVNSEARQLLTLPHTEEYVRHMYSIKPSQVCPHYDYSTCNIHFLARHPQYECQKHGLLPSAKSATQLLPWLHEWRRLLNRCSRSPPVTSVKIQ